MNREKKLFKNTIILTIGSLCTKFVTFLLLPLYTATLSTEEYGIVDLLNTLVMLLLPIVTFQIEQAVFRYLIDARNNENKKSKIISTGCFTVVIQCIICFIVFLFISTFIQNSYKWLLILNLFVYIFASLLQQIARGIGDNKTYSISSVASATTTILFNLLFLLQLRLGAYGMLFGTACGQIFCIIYIIFKLKLTKSIKIKYYDKNLLKELWRYSIPLIPNSISWWVLNASDRIIVSIFLGLSMNGILAAAHKFSGIYITVYNFFQLSWVESISAHINDNDFVDFHNRTLNIVMRFFLAVGLLIMVAMPFVYPIMIDSNYSYGYYQVPIIILGSFFNILIALETAVYYGKKDTKAVSSTAVTAALINIIIHLLLIKYIGLYAATISTLVAYFVMVIYRYKDIEKKYFKIEFDKKVLISASIITIAIIIFYYINNIALNLVSIIIVLIYSYLINKNSISHIINIILDKIKKEVK